MARKKMEIYAYFILILLAWGLWGFMGKYALKFINPVSLILWEAVGSVALYLIVAVIFFLNFKFESNPAGITAAFFTALFGVFGIVIFFFALSKTKASILVPLTALYPVVTIILSLIFLKEKVTLVQSIGIVFAVIASVLLSI
ncbi:DMT family transporter [Candidatus Woesearchaeota archaeon]|nr:DMT family transporter [Candidatus Woesearchaeota archaeon]